VSCPHTQGDDCPICARTLDGNESGDTLIRTPGGPASASQFLPPGTPIGRYLLLGRLGEGGMGVVYTAHDPQLERTVALKLLRSANEANTDQTSGQARLLREAQAMAQLAHPNVVQIYDSGPWGNGVFIVMELVRGRTLDRWVKEKPRTWQEVLPIFLQAGRGLVAAHEAGLVHRDFKPLNVLVGQDGRPRVTDFGLARAAGKASVPEPVNDVDEVTRSGPISLETPLTLLGTMMGTPGYMAPEQYAGEQTSTATDQFAFCVSLYEALYGEQPFKADTLPELEVVTRKGEVPPPPKGSAVPPWLREIVLKGLRPKPGDRHPSLAKLLDALSYDPAAARRRRLVIAGLSALALLSVGGFAWSATQSKRACRGAEEQLDGTWDRKTRDAARAAFTATGVPFAPASFELVTGALDRWSKDWVEARTDACEATRVRGEQTERQLLLRMACLDRRREEVATLTQALGHADRSLVMNAGEALNKLSPLAACANVKQLEDRRQPPPELAALATELEQQLAQARGQMLAGKVLEAEAAITDVSKRARENHLVALESMSAEAATNLSLQLRRFPDARKHGEETLRAAIAAGDDEAAARVLSQLVSLVGWRLEKEAEARTWAALTQGMIDRLGGNVELSARLAEGLGDTEWQAGKKSEALAEYRRSLEGFKQVREDSLDVARLHSSIGWVLTELGELEEANDAYQRSRTMRERLLGVDNPVIAPTWNEIGTLAAERRDYASALEALVRFRFLAQQLDARLEQQLWASANYAVGLAEGGRAAESIAVLDELDRLVASSTEKPQNPEHLVRTRVVALNHLGRYEDAYVLGIRELAISVQLTGKDSRRVAGMERALIEPALETRRYKEALQYAEHYFAWVASAGAVDTPSVGQLHVLAAEAAEAQGLHPGGLEHAERGVKALVRGMKDPAAFARARFTLARLLARVPSRASASESVRLQAVEDAREAGKTELAQRIEAWRAK
jgi:tetratricopeptide (TPR) repeat protein